MTVKNYVNSNAFMEEFTIKPYANGNLENFTFAVKDCIDVENKKTGFGNPSWLNSHPTAAAHAICVEQLLANGAICKGKTITDEFCYSLLGENHFYGTPLNPNAPDRIAGGSSSGSASAVACGLVDFAIGTDTGGSIRVPASNCGIFGYRPSHGRINMAGVLPLAPSLDTVGVLARNSKTLKLASSVLLGREIKDQNSKSSLILLEDVFDACEDNVKNIALEFIQKNFKDYSSIKLCEIIGLDISIKDLFDLYVLLQSSEIWSTLGGWIETEKPELGPIPYYNFHSIAKVANRQLLSKAIETREKITYRLQKFLKDGLLLCFPTTPDVAPKIGLLSQNPEARKSGTYFQRLLGINAIAGLSRSPQITIPVKEKNGLPIGLSFLTAQNHDEILLENILTHHFD